MRKAYSSLVPRSSYLLPNPKTLETFIELHRFYGYWQIIVCSFSAVALLSIWQHITRKDAFRSRDFAMVWLSMAILIWAISGGVELLDARMLRSQGKVEENRLFYDGLRSILSIFNSAFILLALPRFRHMPQMIKTIVRSDSWRLLVIITFAFSVVLTLLMLFSVLVPSEISFIYVVDIIYALFTLFFLGLVLWASFAKRHLHVLAYLSVISIFCTLVAQWSKLWDSAMYNILLNCTFKTILIMLFFALALSWVEEISKTFYLPKAKEMYAVLLKQKQPLQKYAYTAILTIPPNIQTRQISFTEKPYELLHRFASKRIEEEEDRGWLEIQPKTATGKTYDIKDYNEINRILELILNDIYGTGNWSVELEKKNLKTALFEYGQHRKIRLRMSRENISL